MPFPPCWHLMSLLERSDSCWCTPSSYWYLMHSNSSPQCYKMKGQMSRYTRYWLIHMSNSLSILQNLHNGRMGTKILSPSPIDILESKSCIQEMSTMMHNWKCIPENCYPYPCRYRVGCRSIPPCRLTGISIMTKNSEWKGHIARCFRTHNTKWSLYSDLLLDIKLASRFLPITCTSKDSSGDSAIVTCRAPVFPAMECLGQSKANVENKNLAIETMGFDCSLLRTVTEVDCFVDLDYPGPGCFW